MNDSSNSLPPSGDDALEARIVAWVLGEASPFEAAELEKLCAENPKLREFERRMRDLNEILEVDAKPGDDAAWKLPTGKREKVTDLLGVVAGTPAEGKVNHYFARRILLAAAACVAISLVSYPLFSGGVMKMRKSVSPESAKAVDFLPARPAADTPETETAVKRKAFLEPAGPESELLGHLSGAAGGGEEGMAGADVLAAEQNRPQAPAATAAPALMPAEPELLAKQEAVRQESKLSAKDSAEGRMFEAEKQLAQLSDKVEQAERGRSGEGEMAGRTNEDFFGTVEGVHIPEMPPTAGANVTDVVTGGLRSGDGQINRNNLDAASDGPAALSVPGQAPAKADALAAALPKGEAGSLSDAAQGAFKDELSLGLAGVPVNEAAFVPRDADSSAYRFSRREVVPRKPGEMPVQDIDGYIADDVLADAKASDGRFTLDVDGASAAGGSGGGALAGRGDRSAIAAAERFFFGSAETSSAFGFAGGSRGLDEPPQLTLGVELHYKDSLSGLKELQPGVQLVPSSQADFDEDRAKLLAEVDTTWGMSPPPPGPREATAGAKRSAGASELAQKEIARRQSTVAEADRFVEEGAKARESGDLEKAYKLHVDGLGRLPEAPAVDVRRAEVKRSLSEIAAGLAVDAKAKGNKEAAKEWAGKALQWNPQQKEAKEILDLGGGDETSAVAEPFSTFSLHVSDASFKLAKAALDRGEQPDPTGIRAEEFYNAFDYGDPAPAQGEPVVCVTEQAAHPILPQRNLVRIGVRTAAAGRGGSTPLNLTLLLDSSGSMEREDRQAAMLRAVEQLSGLLKEGDTITVAGFARQPRLLADRLPGARAQELNTLIAQTPSEGGTNLEEGLKLAEELAKRQFNAAAQNRIVLFTDGAANLGDAQPESLQARVEQLRQQGIAFDAAGFGAEGLNDRLLERLTRNGNGRYYVVDRAEDAGEGFAKQLAGAFRPAAENVKVQVRFNAARVARYKLIGFEEHRLAKEDFKNDAVDAAEMAAEEAGNALYQIQAIPGGEGEIGEVSVRFRDVASGQMVERTWTIPYEAQVPVFDQAASSMQLAGLAMFAAEKLRQAPMAEAIDFGQLGSVMAGVKARYAGSEAVAELEGMIGKLK
jgi:Mg-chelatase subunit ChlD